MNHDYAHCVDQDKTCPESCFRRQLNEDLQRRKAELAYMPVSWMHLRDTTNCKRRNMRETDLVCVICGRYCGEGNQLCPDCLDKLKTMKREHTDLLHEMFGERP